MATEATESTITVHVPERLARAFNAAHEQERRKWELLVRFQLEAVAMRKVRTFAEIMADLGAQAEANGLTHEEFEAILAEPDDAGGV